VVVAGAALVRINPEAKSPEVGLLREGAVVTVTRCEPNCAAKEAWAILGSDGAIRLSLLRRVPGAINPAPVPAPVAEVLTYGRVGPGGITIYKAANLHSPVLTRRRGTREIVFRPNPALRARGWLERVEGGFVLAKWVTTLKPSTLKGEAQPHLPLAFVTRALATAPTPGISAHRLHRYDRLPLLGLDGPRIATTSGSVPRRDVRIVKLQAPPPGIPAGARWVHVDLKEQTLTAYEGENPVFATLISSGKVNAKGKAETATLPGLYQVEHKLIYSNMNGQRDDPYAVDRVPHVQYFHKGDALHGAYWHDGFGAVASHGCINLSLADAAWLFAWAPPRLPEAWSSVEASEPGLQTLWVFVDPKAPMPPVAVNNAAPPPPVGVSQPSRPQRLVADRQ